VLLLRTERPLSLHAVRDDTIEVYPFCCVFTAAETPNAFQWAGQPPKLPLLFGDLDPHLIQLFLGPT